MKMNDGAQSAAKNIFQAWENFLAAQCVKIGRSESENANEQLFITNKLKKITDFGNEVKRVTSTDDNQGDDDGGNGGEMGQN